MTPVIHATNPSTMMFGEPLDPPELELFGTGLVPAGATWDQLPGRVKAFARIGSGSFAPAEWANPSDGWSETQITIQLPALGGSNEAFLQIKVVVDGVESKIYGVPIVPQPTPAVPHISFVSPNETVYGSNPYYFILQVYATGMTTPMNARPHFQGQEVENWVASYMGKLVEFSVPEQYRNTPGSYTVQIMNDLGYSNIVFWDLVTKPEIKDITPTSITPSMVQANAPATPVKITFGTSNPKTIKVRVTPGGGWHAHTVQSINGYTTVLALPFAGLKPGDKVEIKLVNAAGESESRVLHVPIKFQPPRPRRQ